MDPIYVDLDDTLIRSDVDAKGGVTRIFPRPGAGRFLRRLSGVGPVYILSYATLSHVQDGLEAIGAEASFVSGILSREDLVPVIDALERISWEATPPRDRVRMIEGIPAIVPPGVIFDDQPVGSWYYLVKSTAAGIRSGMWIQVPAYTQHLSDHDALDRAYRKFHRMFVGTTFLGAAGRSYDQRNERVS
jgi:hypothetical protein